VERLSIAHHSRRRLSGRHLLVRKHVDIAAVKDRLNRSGIQQILVAPGRLPVLLNTMGGLIEVPEGAGVAAEQKVRYTSLICRFDDRGDWRIGYAAGLSFVLRENIRRPLLIEMLEALQCPSVQFAPLQSVWRAVDPLFAEMWICVRPPV
jgi:hypothetical protein